MCPEVADKANPGKEASPTGRAEVAKRRAVGAVHGGSSLACCTFLLNMNGPALLRCLGCFDDELVPGGSVRGERLPGLNADVRSL